jgi:hypothetical protein
LLTYRIDEASPGEVQSDPFGGHGIFLAMDAPAAEILAALEEAAGTTIPAVAFEGSGAWLDVRGQGPGLTAVTVERWGNKQAVQDDRG